MNINIKQAVTGALSLSSAFWAMGAHAGHVDAFTINYDDGTNTFNQTISSTTGYAHGTFAWSVPGWGGAAYILALYEPGQTSCATTGGSTDFSLGTCSDAFFAQIDATSTNFDMYLVSTAASQADLNAFYAAVNGWTVPVISLNTYNLAEETGGVQAANISEYTGQPFFAGSTVQSSDVPEPESLALLVAGLAGLGVVRRRKAVTAH